MLVLKGILGGSLQITKPQKIENYSLRQKNSLKRFLASGHLKETLARPAGFRGDPGKRISA